MEIRDLSNCSLEEIVFAMLMAFEEYFLKMPSDTTYWKHRYQAARVDWTCSFGMFDQGELIAFIINGIDERGTHRVAFNTGTGVIKKYRGQKIVDQLYAYAFPILQQKGVTCCALEVIQENSRAIRVYERIGFSITKEYLCFTGKLEVSNYETTIHKIDFEKITNPQANWYAWDNSNRAIQLSSKGTYTCYEVFSLAKEKIGFFVINEQSGNLPQFEIYKTNQQEDWQLLFDGIAQVSRTIRTINIDAKRTDILQTLRYLGMENSINQYEMELKMKP
ncbi:GNAT family N-acetyltransferase [Aureispira sp. CCB-QB1]|uniref:GNAT family N-acetyltransferase n=1 Tax=Aureispira sp. CCB-QB1 TaxID=1313421 RepID=UPI000697519A|nr:GNAT family N-acetyltransferase [Aureispira sp. CCB-QB1]